MKKHFNLYYIFREEQVLLALSEEKSAQIQAFLEEFARTIRAKTDNGKDQGQEGKSQWLKEKL